MTENIRADNPPAVEKACDIQSIADRAAFHLAGIGASLIAAAARLRETEDFEPGRGGVSEALKELEHLSQVLNEIREGNAPAAAEILDDLIFGKVLRQLH